MSGQRSFEQPDRPIEAPQPGGASGEPPEQRLIAYLEPDQLVAETFRPVPRATLPRNAAVGLWVLRVFVVLVSVMVLYTFLARLH